MLAVKRLILDVLKPHQPNALEFCQAIAKAGDDYLVKITVKEVDEETETLAVEIIGDLLNFELIQATISENGGSLHSIDEVEVENSAAID